MKPVDMRAAPATLKRATGTIRAQLSSDTVLVGSVRLILDFDESDTPIWSTEFAYKRRRRAASQVFYGPAAELWPEAIDNLLTEVLTGLP